MPGGMLGGAQSGSGSGQGATVFNPPNQAAAADALNQLILPLLGLSANAGAGTPAGQNYPFARDSIFGNIVNNPYANQAIWGSQQAAQNAFNTAAPDAFGGGSALYGTAMGGLPFAQQALQQGFDPRYDAAIAGLASNPYYGGALAGAQRGAEMGGQGAESIFNMAGQIGGSVPAIQGLAGQIGGSVPAIQGLAGQMGSLVNPLIQSGFDPQAALFNRSQGRLMDQTNAINAMSGLAGTPYGASVGANAMGNFNIDWENQQLARQVQGAGAAGNAASTAGGLYGQAGNVAGQAGSLYGQAGNVANQAAGLYGAAPGLAASSAALPSNAYTNNISQLLQGLAARGQGANQGIAGFGSLLGAGGSGLGQSNTLNLSGVGAQQQYGAAPYNTQSGIGSNTLSGLSNLTQLGNNQFALPQQEIGNLMDYMGLGQRASGLSGQLGNLGFNQTAQGLGGLLGGANTLFGQRGMFPLMGSSGILPGSPT